MSDELNDELRKRVWHLAAGAFLCTQFADEELDEMTDEEQCKEFEDNAWEPLEGIPGTELKSIIESHAYCIEQLFKEVKRNGLL